MSKNLFIICGHGDTDSGATGHGFTEAERVRTLATLIKKFGGNSVTLADFNLHGAKSNLIGKGLVPKGSLILELHLDSFSNENAKGGHVIIHTDFEPDKYDLALAEMLKQKYSGRAEVIDGRNDLINLNRAKQYGYNYRLLECCFISNKEDITKFNNNMEEYAKDILKCFEIEIVENKENKKKDNSTIADEVIAQKWGNGAERKKLLTEAGYDYETIQKIVNIRMGYTKNKPEKTNGQIADEVIQGLWGNGEDRKERLTQAGYNYKSIQTIVNQRYGK